MQEKTEKSFTCIVCPVGCTLNVSYADGELRITGNNCPRGAKYAANELTNPVRTLTSTVKTANSAHKRLPVKSDSPIPKGEMMAAMEKIHSLTVSPPVKCGDILIEKVAGDANIVACRNLDN